jgi:predicted esterase
MSRSLFLLALLVAAPAGPAFAQGETPPVQKPPEKPPVEKPPEKAQEKPDKNTLNRRAIDAFQAKKYDEGIAALMKILETEPKDKGTAYNLACGYALKGDVEKGFEWLGKSVDWGWGPGTGTLVSDAGKPKTETDMAKLDPDLELLRKDPRWEKLLERMSKAAGAGAAASNPTSKRFEEYAAKPASYIPEKAAAAKEMPILVVLHDAGSTKDQVVAGRWKAVADELGFALLAPSGKVGVGEDPSKGMAWYGRPEEYAAASFAVEKAVTEAIAAFAKEHPLDKSRTVLVGEGAGGLVALNLGINGQGLCKGVVTVNGTFNPDLFASKAPSAGKLGLKVELLHDPAKAPKDVATTQNRLLQTWGLPGESKVWAPDAGDKTVLVEAVRAVLTPAATPAAAPK